MTRSEPRTRPAPSPGGKTPQRICPRCGYDLSGIIDAWHASCPLRGICSECGEAFDWFAIFHPDHDDVRGFVEHAPLDESETRGFFRRRLAFLARAWRTWMWTLLPGRFWGRVHVHHRLSPTAMLAWLPALLLPLHIIAATLSMALSRLQELTYFGPLNRSVLRYLSSWTYPVAVFDRWGGSAPRLLIGAWPGYVLPALALHTTVAATLLVLGSTRRQAKLRFAHIGRAFVYGLSWLVFLTAYRAARNAVVVVQEFINWQDGSRPPPITRGAAVVLGGTPVQPLYLANVAPGLLGLLLFTWLGLWWLRAVRRGWELPRAGLIWTLLMVVGLLAALNAWVLVYVR